MFRFSFSCKPFSFLTDAEYESFYCINIAVTNGTSPSLPFQLQCSVSKDMDNTQSVQQCSATPGQLPPADSIRFEGSTGTIVFFPNFFLLFGYTTEIQNNYRLNRFRRNYYMFASQTSRGHSTSHIHVR